MPKARTTKTALDWAATRERLALATAALQERVGGDAAEKAERALLAQRAKALAAPARAGDSAEATIEVVAFELGGQVFGLEAGLVRETVRPRDLTPLPGLPGFVRGLVNIRSRVVPTFDLRPLLQVRAPAGRADEALVVVNCEGIEFAVVVEQVLGLRNVAPGRLRADVPGLDARHLRGLTEDGLILLELSALVPDLAVAEDTDA